MEFEPLRLMVEDNAIQKEINQLRIFCKRQHKNVRVYK